MAVPNFFQQFFPKRLVKISNGQKWLFEFFLTISPKKTGLNLEWPKMAVPNFFQQFFPKRLVKIQNGQKLQIY